MAMANPYQDKTNELINRMMQQTSQQPQQMYQPAPYQGFNPSSNHSYQSALSEAQRNAGTATNNAMVAAGSKGIGNSSLLSDRMAQIQQNAMGRVSDTMLPQYEQMDYNRYRDFVGDQYRTNEINYNRGQDQYRNTNDLAKYMSDLTQRGTDNARADASLTGHYMPDGAQDIINRILNLKQQAERPGVASDQMGQFKSEADNYRTQLQRMGIDPSIVGFDADYNQASQNAANFRGIPTLQAQNQALQAQQQQFSQGMANRQQDMNEVNMMANLTGYLPDGSPTNAYQQQQLRNEWDVADRTGVITPTIAQMYGMQPGTQTQAAKQFAMNYGLQQQSTGLARERFDWEKEQAGNRNNLDRELEGLYTGLSTGQTDTAAAIDEINERMRLGILDPTQGAQMLALVQQFIRNRPASPTPTVTTEQAKEAGKPDYQNFTTKQMEQLWKSDPTGQQAGRPQFDWAMWVRDPRGRDAGITFEAYMQAHGPRMG